MTDSIRDSQIEPIDKKRPAQKDNSNRDLLERNVKTSCVNLEDLSSEVNLKT